MAPRSKLDLLGLVERTVNLYQNEKMSHRKITELYKSEGIDIEKSAIGRTLKNHSEWLVADKQVREQARMMLEQYKDNPNTDIQEMLQNMMQAKLVDYVRSVDGFEFDKPSDLFEAMASLSRSQVNVSRLRMEYQDGVEAAKVMLEEELIKTLKNEEPALLKQLIDVVRALKIDKKKTKGKSRK